MRQATPHIQWFSLVFADDSIRHEFLAALEDNPPVAILLTNSQWSQPDGFDAADGWSPAGLPLKIVECGQTRVRVTIAFAIASCEEGGFSDQAGNDRNRAPRTSPKN
jgi:hypothetical protein